MTPGATALNRMPCLAYSIARLRVMASSPPLVTMATEALIPAMGFEARAAVMHAGSRFHLGDFAAGTRRPRSAAPLVS